ncbi:MAG: hypothetical protein Q8Q86_01695 [Candidatus Daviesbacteria bacterium]|nr:hypothetical protein [Candidatus Daviesbacteria bacterium]
MVDNSIFNLPFSKIYFPSSIIYCQKLMNNLTLHVRIVSPQQLLLDTEAQSVSSKNLQGNFDILPQHANFITMVENSPIVVRQTEQKPLTFKFPLAIIITVENKVNIYTYIQPQLEKK